jgi:hypothetical protein
VPQGVRLLLLASALGLVAGAHGCSRVTEPELGARGEPPNAPGNHGALTNVSSPRFEWPRGRQLIAEAKEALGAVLTGEQVYYQKFGTFTDAADATDLRVEIGVDLSESSRRWAFAVSAASVTGFVATARGRDDTQAEGIVVTLSYVRGQPPMWTVRHRA